VLGLDGVDPRAVSLLAGEGRLPNFERLRREGAFGPLQSDTPMLSPILWTTIATGKTADEHGIGHFVAVNEKTGERLPVTSRMRRVRALWNIASDAGRRVGVVGWWATWPAEAVRGTVVSDHTCYHFLFPEGATGSASSEGVFHPPEVEPHVRPLVQRPSDLTAEDLVPFVRVSPEDLARPFDFGDDLGHFRWALATTRSYAEIGRFLWQRESPDLLLVYLEGPDSTSHLFGHLFRTEGLAGDLARQQEKFGGTVEAMYVEADRILGRFLAEMDDDTTLVVLSDHGFDLGALPDDPTRLRDMRRVSERFHHEQGILFLYGRNVRAGAELRRPTLVDITPTVLALLGLPAARDMPGRVLSEALTVSEPVRIASYETNLPQRADAKGDPAADPAILEHLRSLGYLEASSPEGERNLAALHFRAGRYEEALQAYQAQVAEHPRNSGLRTSLAACYGALGRYEEALAQLDEAEKLDPVSPEVHHNRAVVFERLGRTADAVAAYRTARRYAPHYQPARDALVRLVGPEALQPTVTGEQQRAVVVAERAADAARRGDFVAAQRLLDEAEKIAPDLALVYHYRANAAFLQGDRAGAAQALHRALEIEPDNALFRTNLKRLAGKQGDASAAAEGDSPARPPGAAVAGD
jgi:Flp pilus assembly protein TadD